ncbi:tRNA (N6-threonylcarbamoyladenosine(37)-N6)-methyltransferase TrmO [Kibdelosporangium philippinense]|uniref:tRNA (N6-threonylcarbamoyladenosine(37)-N6)-methyltransferase TrmO n=1 Tax=Kibdelosporangium philippinense TaxID=211113 RepID=A0ABS8Z3K6_9PSEU|nr:tRNA (N6-threonylcarbamoyladenosine(37)-N6)-methyltransferase TrmO [Kibdelosporangium philippinense]MCE7002509.1 tRNA (N6-threonylcarbamoyladenosine(37)-N6)-methyltransferase TrmO [Kibdelosporangium philippinense]
MRCPLTVIGVVRTGPTDPADTPVQAALNRVEHGELEVAEEFAAGLADVDGFDHVWLLSWLGLGDEARPPMAQVPFLLRPKPRLIGMFATRSPKRINPIGLSLVRVIEVRGRVLRFAGVDMVDGTPIIDVKPYVPAFDQPQGPSRSGWIEEVELNQGVTPGELGR